MTDMYTAGLININLFLLIPIALFVAIILYQLVMLLQTVSGFVTLAQYELTPALKDLRATAEHVEVLSSKARAGVESVERGVQATRPKVTEGVEKSRPGPSRFGAA